MAFPRQQTAEQTRPANWFAAWHWTRKAKNKTDMILCVYWGLLVQNFISFNLNRHIWAKSNSHCRKRFFLSQCSNPSLSAVNPIFKVQKKENPSSHFIPSGPSISCLNRILESLKKQLETEGCQETSLILLNSVKTKKWSISYRAESHCKKRNDLV